MIKKKQKEKENFTIPLGELIPPETKKALYERAGVVTEKGRHISLLNRRELAALWVAKRQRKKEVKQ